jgi:hypothetical protein
MADNKPHPRITTEEMQRRFNEGDYWARMQAGEFTEVVLEYHPNTAYPEVIERHPGSKSVTTHYLDREGRVIAELHYFRMPDGSIIPGKRPDPKLLFEDGVLYHQEKGRDRRKRLAAEEQTKTPPQDPQSGESK